MKKSKSISLISAIVFFVIGIILFTNPDVVIKFISYCLGGVLILIGIYKTANYYIQDKRLGVVNRNELAFGITAIVLGVVFIFLADAIELLLRFIVGIWVLIAGLNKIIQTFYTTDRGSKFYSLLVVGLALIGIGLYIILVSNLALSIIGIFMIIYGLIDFVSYFIYRNKIESPLNENDNDNVIMESSNIIEAEEVSEKKEKPKKKEKSKSKNKKRG